MRTKIQLIVGVMILLAAASLVAQPRHRGHGDLWPSLSTDYDQNQDGQVTLDEFGDAEATFGHLDKNDDGVLSADDFAGRGGPRMRVGMRSRSGGAGFLHLADSDADGAVTSAELDAFLGTVDADADGVIEHDELRVAAGAAGNRAPRGPHGSGAGGTPPHQRLFDHDQDGTVEVEDFRLIFAELDADGDGQVTAEELPSRHFRERRASRGPGGPGRGGALLAHHADADGDGEITGAEWQGFVGQLDADGSGEIDGAEWQAAVPGPEGHEPPPEMFERIRRFFDRNDNGILEVSDFDAIFNELDSNGSGVIEADELPRHRFRRRA